MSDEQQSLPGFTQRANAISKRASKARQAKRVRYRLPVVQPALIADHGFNPVGGVPKNRGECPTTGYCPHVRCRMHLAMEDAEHRAGRPGLANVPRDEKGLTLPSRGSAGHERSGTTLRPTWMRLRGVELEREVKVWLHPDEDGLHVYESQHGAMDYWLARLHIGETVLVINDESTSAFYKQPVAHVTLPTNREV